MANTYYKHIDGLRAIAVLSVFLYHLGFPGITGGFVGVDIFFVISGYLITGIILPELQETGRFSFVGFYFRRAKRIFPALAVTLVTSFALAVWLLPPAKFKLFGGTFAAAAASVANIFLYRQAGYFDIFSKTNPLLHTWSLGVEEQFYIVWPVLLLLAFVTIGKRWGALVVLTLLAFISFYLNVRHQGSSPTRMYFLVQYRAFEFCIGAAVLWLPQAHTILRRRSHEALCAIGFVLTLAPFFLYTELTPFPTYNALAPAIGTALLIYAGSAPNFGWLLRTRVAVFIGLISYSLYLVHWPLITFVMAYNENVGLTFALGDWQRIAVGFAAIGLAYLMYKYVERPTRRIRIGMTRAQGFFVAKWIGALAVAAVAGVGMFRGNGWLWRVDSPFKATEAQTIAEFHTAHWGGAGFDGGLIHTGQRPEPSLIMMGDSHSGMLDTGVVREIAVPLGLTVFTASGGSAGKYESSLLLPGTTRIDKNQASFDLSSRNANVEAIRQLERSPNSVLMYSAFYRGQLPIAGDLLTHRPWNINPEKSGNEDDYQPFVAALERLRQSLDGRQFVIIGDFPGSSKYFAPQCVAQLRWFHTDACKAEQPRFDNIAAINVNRVIRKYAATHRNVHFIDPYDVFCDEKRCRNLDPSGAPLYSDGKHLSKSGSILFFDMTRSRLRRILEAS
ncbi:acyltransferase family protein [Pandoraea pulmonicola]|uniref:O-acetyltransferase OatA n=1 Tax=Pandoraea pulmonicola TaxID=93221 RepID=A0AAJ5D2V9_PANPU|nr:acyltransferase family protein [Pandoraea pulmonicola]AJC22645.1 hypothetical protein RO07_23205 [Pandoraea pulmonicola]SUA93127.1 O-acetyltransferase OatA [Pandoraea pulmonicola]